MTNAFDSLIASAAARYSVPPALIKSVIAVESGGDPNAKALSGGDGARGGSYGLMQMSLATARALGYTGDANGLLDPTTNIDLGTRYLADLLRQTRGAVDAAISGYNAGLSSVRPADGKRVTNDPSSPFINQSYVDRVKSYLGQFSTAQLAAGGAGILLLGFGALLLAGRRHGG